MLEMLEHYQPSPLEDVIISFYKKHHITDPQDIDLDWMAHEAGVWLHYKAHNSISYQLRQNMWTVIVDDRLPEEQQRVELAHELGHVFLHTGHQMAMSADFRAMQEWQADRFAFYTLCPTPMMAKCIVTGETRTRMVEQLAYTFNVPDYFMDARLKLLEDRLRMLSTQKQFEAVLETMPKYGRDYDTVVRHPVNHQIEYYLRDGHVVYARRRAQL